MAVIEQHLRRSVRDASTRKGSVWSGSARKGSVWSGSTQSESIPNRSAIDSELVARRALQGQVARLERQISNVVAAGFPHVEPCDRTPGAAHGALGPRLLSLGELERVRDRLATELRDACRQAEERAELARRSHALLEEMKRDPARHKFVRLAVRDLGEGHCGFWQVRPRLGLIGMLAGWWEVKLSSGCP